MLPPASQWFEEVWCCRTTRMPCRSASPCITVVRGEVRAGSALGDTPGQEFGHSSTGIFTVLALFRPLDIYIPCLCQSTSGMLSSPVYREINGEKEKEGGRERKTNRSRYMSPLPGLCKGIIILCKYSEAQVGPQSERAAPGTRGRPQPAH